MTSVEFAERIVEMQETLYRVCYSILPRACDREDAVQECILIAWQKRDSLRDERYMQTWVIRILIHECYALLRKGKREHPTDMLPERTPPPGADMDLHDALMTLPTALRLPVTLHYLEGYPLATVAKMLRLPGQFAGGGALRYREDHSGVSVRQGEPDDDALLGFRLLH